MGVMFVVIKEELHLPFIGTKRFTAQPWDYSMTSIFSGNLLSHSQQSL